MTEQKKGKKFNFVLACEQALLEHLRIKLYSAENGENLISAQSQGPKI